MDPYTFRTEGGEELVILARRDYDVLLARLGDEEAELRLLGARAAEIQRRTIVSVTHDHDLVTGWGVHRSLRRGRWLVNGSSRGLVALTMQPPAHGRCYWRVPVRLHVLRLSLDAPDAFIDDLHA